MTGAEITALGWLAGLLKELSATLLGERLKPKPSSEGASAAALSLYKSLDALCEASEGFVTALRERCHEGHVEASDALSWALDTSCVTD